MTFSCMYCTEVFFNRLCQHVVGDCMDIPLSQSTLSNCLTTVARALTSQCDTYVKFPSTGPEILRNQQEFYGFRNIPNIVGLIDCTHVKIIRPKENEDIFIKRHGYHSVNVQMICDSSSKITNICCMWPGSTHDSTILCNSNSNSNSTFIALNLYLMIDSKTQKAKIRDHNR